jgi:seryl-tRNA synthetase
MLDIRMVRAEPDRVKAELAKVGFPAAEVDALLDADRRRREAIQAIERLRAERTAASKAIRDEGSAARERAIEAQRDREHRRGRAAAGRRRGRSTGACSRCGTCCTPTSRSACESANVVVRTVGEPRTFDFQPQPHWDLGPRLGLIDFDRGVKISGSRFYVLRGAGARLQRALISWMLDLHTREHGYVEVYPPAMVKAECLVGTGNLPKFGDNLYRDAEEDLWWIPTAEVPVTNLYRDEVLDAAALPIRHVAYSPPSGARRCRRAARRASCGKPVRGVEMVFSIRWSDAELASLSTTRRTSAGASTRPPLVQMCTATSRSPPR